MHGFLKHPAPNIQHPTAIGIERLLELFCCSSKDSECNKKRLAKARPVTTAEGIAQI